jgi:hypothetical protein
LEKEEKGGAIVLLLTTVFVIITHLLHVSEGNPGISQIGGSHMCGVLLILLQQQPPPKPSVSS